MESPGVEQNRCGHEAPRRCAERGTISGSARRSARAVEGVEFACKLRPKHRVAVERGKHETVAGGVSPLKHAAFVHKKRGRGRILFRERLSRPRPNTVHLRRVRPEHVEGLRYAARLRQAQTERINLTKRTVLSPGPGGSPEPISSNSARN